MAIATWSEIDVLSAVVREGLEPLSQGFVWKLLWKAGLLKVEGIGYAGWFEMKSSRYFAVVEEAIGLSWIFAGRSRYGCGCKVISTGYRLS